MKRLTRDDTEHGVEYYRADEVDALNHTEKPLEMVSRIAVPDEIDETDISEHPEYIQGWNDCRALMLGGKP